MESNNQTLSTRNIYGITFIAIALLILFNFWIWYKSNDSVNQLKEEVRTSYLELVRDGYHRPIELNFKSKGDSIIIVNKAEFEKINSYLDYLSTEIRRETNRAESIIDKDIDRLNLYMAIGIGFMTLLGVFVPVLVNITSAHDFRVKQEKFEEELNKLKEEDKGLDELRKDISNTTLNLAIQNLQSAIGRFYYVGPTLTSSFGKVNFERFIELLQLIKNALKTCNELSEHSINGSPVFKTTIEDFIHFVKSAGYKTHPIFSERKDVEIFDDLEKSLRNLISSSSEIEKPDYKQVIKVLDRLIEIYESKKKENKLAVQKV